MCYHRKNLVLQAYRLGELFILQGDLLIPCIKLFCAIRELPGAFFNPALETVVQFLELPREFLPLLAPSYPVSYQKGCLNQHEDEDQE